MSRPCDCLSCRDVEFLLTGVGEHVYTLQDRQNEDYGWDWRWRCACRPRALGAWQGQSPNVAYHAWKVHAGLESRR